MRSGPSVASTSRIRSVALRSSPDAHVSLGTYSCRYRLSSRASTCVTTFFFPRKLCRFFDYCFTLAPISIFFFFPRGWIHTVDGRMDAAATAAAYSSGASPWTLVSLLHPRAWAPMPSVILNAAKAARDHPRPGIEPILVRFPLFLLTCPLETPSDDPWSSRAFPLSFLFLRFFFFIQMPGSSAIH